MEVVVVPLVVVEVVNVQDQVTEVSVAPVTMAVSVAAWLTTSVPPDGVTLTATTFPGVPPPHPASETQPATAARTIKLKKFRHLIPTVFPQNHRQYFPKLTSVFNRIRRNKYSPATRPISPQNVRLTVKRNVRSGSK